MASARHLVVVAGAEPAATDALASALRDDGTVRTAYSADALRESLDAEVDVVLVDAELVDGSLDSLLTDVRTREFDCQIGVTTADPDDSVALETHVDTVVGREPEAVREAVQWLATRARYRGRLDEFYDLAERRASLADGERDQAALDRLDRQLDRLRRDLDDLSEDLGEDSVFDAALSPDERALASRTAREDTAAEGPGGPTDSDDE
mgnify:CR=1 FL=1